MSVLSARGSCPVLLRPNHRALRDDYASIERNGSMSRSPSAPICCHHRRQISMSFSDPHRGLLPSRRALKAALLLTLCLLTAAPSSRAADGSGVVYVESNTPNNKILAYGRTAQGILFPLPGMPFETGGS